jgi:hypothetical protein
VVTPEETAPLLHLKNAMIKHMGTSAESPVAAVLKGIFKVICSKLLNNIMNIAKANK